MTLYRRFLPIYILVLLTSYLWGSPVVAGVSAQRIRGLDSTHIKTGGIGFGSLNTGIVTYWQSNIHDSLAIHWSAFVASSTGDITKIYAGYSLYGGGDADSVGIAFDSTVTTVIANPYRKTSAVSDSLLVTWGSMTGKGYLTAEMGDIEGVTAGYSLSGGGTSGTPTLNFDTAAAKTVIGLPYKTTSGTAESLLATVHYLRAAVNESLQTNWTTFATVGSGDITGVAAGNGLLNGGTSGDVTLDVGPGWGISVDVDSVKMDSTELDNTFPLHSILATATDTGFIVGTGFGTYVRRSITSSSPLSVGYPYGKSGNPIVSLNAQGINKTHIDTTAGISFGNAYHVTTNAAESAYVSWGSMTGKNYLTVETGDISGVSVSSPISGGGSSGNVTIGLDTTAKLVANPVYMTTSKEADSLLVTWGSMTGKGYLVTETGDISNVSVTSPISGGGSSGSVTIGFDTTAKLVSYPVYMKSSYYPDSLLATWGGVRSEINDSLQTNWLTFLAGGSAWDTTAKLVASTLYMKTSEVPSSLLVTWGSVAAKGYTTLNDVRTYYGDSVQNAYDKPAIHDSLFANTPGFATKSNVHDSAWTIPVIVYTHYGDSMANAYDKPAIHDSMFANAPGYSTKGNVHDSIWTIPTVVYTHYGDSIKNAYAEIDPTLTDDSIVNVGLADAVYSPHVNLIFKTGVFVGTGPTIYADGSRFVLQNSFLSLKEKILYLSDDYPNNADYLAYNNAQFVFNHPVRLGADHVDSTGVTIGQIRNGAELKAKLDSTEVKIPTAVSADTTVGGAARAALAVLADSAKTVRINSIDSTNIIANSVSMSGDIHVFSTADFASRVTGETGTGAVVFGTDPVLNQPMFTPQATVYGASDPAVDGPIYDMRRERDGTPTSDVDSGDYLGQIRFRGYHTDGYYTAATVRGVVDGEGGSDSMPGLLEFSTSSDGSATPTMRMAIDKNGGIYKGEVTADSALPTIETVEDSTIAVRDWLIGRYDTTYLMHSEFDSLVDGNNYGYMVRIAPRVYSMRKITSGSGISIGNSNPYAGNTSVSIVDQGVLPSHLDSTSRNFIFNDAYRGTSNAAESLLTSLNLVRVVINDSLQTNWGNFVAAGGGGDITAVIAGNGLTGGATIGDATLDVGPGWGVKSDADSVVVDSTELDDVFPRHAQLGSAVDTGLLVSTGLGTYTHRKLTGTSPVSITFSYGKSGNPTIALNEQGVNKNYIDTTSANVPFNDAYRVTTETAESLLITQGWAKRLIRDSLQTNWSTFIYGDITSVSPGYGLVGGGTSGDVTLRFDSTITTVIANPYKKTSAISDSLLVTWGKMRKTIGDSLQADWSTFVTGGGAKDSTYNLITARDRFRIWSGTGDSAWWTIDGIGTTVGYTKGVFNRVNTDTLDATIGWINNPYRGDSVVAESLLTTARLTRKIINDSLQTNWTAFVTGGTANGRTAYYSHALVGAAANKSVDSTDADSVYVDAGTLRSNAAFTFLGPADGVGSLWSDSVWSSFLGVGSTTTRYWRFGRSAGTGGQVLSRDGDSTKWIDAGGTGTITGVTAGNGLTGGGTSGTVTLNTVGGWGISVYGDSLDIDSTGLAAVFTKKSVVHDSVYAPGFATKVNVHDSLYAGGVATKVNVHDSVYAPGFATKVNVHDSVYAPGFSTKANIHDSLDAHWAAWIAGAGGDTSYSARILGGTLYSNSDSLSLRGDTLNSTAGTTILGPAGSGHLWSDTVKAKSLQVGGSTGQPTYRLGGSTGTNGQVLAINTDPTPDTTYWKTETGGGAAVWDSLNRHIDTLEVLYSKIDTTTAKIPTATLADSTVGGAVRATTAEKADSTTGGAARATTSARADSTVGGSVRATTCKTADSSVAIPDSIAALALKVDRRVKAQSVKPDTLVVGTDNITDLTGTGLSISSGALQVDSTIGGAARATTSARADSCVGGAVRSTTSKTADSANGGAIRAVTASKADSTTGGSVRATTSVRSDSANGGAIRAETSKLADSAKSFTHATVNKLIDERSKDADSIKGKLINSTPVSGSNGYVMKYFSAGDSIGWTVDNAGSGGGDTAHHARVLGGTPQNTADSAFFNLAGASPDTFCVDAPNVRLGTGTVGSILNYWQYVAPIYVHGFAHPSGDSVLLTLPMAGDIGTGGAYGEGYLYLDSVWATGNDKTDTVALTFLMPAGSSQLDSLGLRYVMSSATSTVAAITGIRIIRNGISEYTYGGSALCANSTPPTWTKISINDTDFKGGNWVTVFIIFDGDSNAWVRLYSAMLVVH